uniref:Uncharacterized protein n=1 Tax=Magallana gigas TaxID=29159 RepID=K1RI34_MAGGI
MFKAVKIFQTNSEQFRFVRQFSNIAEMCSELVQRHKMVVLTVNGSLVLTVNDVNPRPSFPPFDPDNILKGDDCGASSLTTVDSKSVNLNITPTEEAQPKRSRKRKLCQGGENIVAAVRRHIQELGLAATYMKREATHRYLNQLKALPFLPAPDISAAFQTLKERANTEPLQSLVNYIDRQWMNHSVFHP